MNKSSAFVSSFIVFLLGIVFGEHVLQVSSAGGGISNFNGTSNQQLDPVKLKFTEGIYIDLKCEKVL